MSPCAQASAPPACVRLLAGAGAGVRRPPCALAPAAAACPAAPGGRRVGVGDSYISGEAGRWAGNSSNPAQTDALGPSAYLDAGTGEAIAGCHRSTSAEIGIGTLASANLACSGAATATVPYTAGVDFKPGLDFYDDGHGHVGQALALQRFAAGHRVALVAVSIGGNDFHFASIVTSLRGGLPDLTGVVEELLPRRRVGDGRLHRGQRRRACAPRSRLRCATWPPR